MHKAIHRVLLATTALAAGLLPGRGWSDPPPTGATDIGAVQATGGAGTSTASTPATAAQIAPSRPPLSASQPTSVVGPDYIQNNVLPQQNYDEIIKFTPSVQNVAPVGPGLQQNFAETIRGFNYTQFNTIFDGIPIPGTPSSFAPETEAYFTGHDIGSVSIDRGPGTASTIGNATFGGTVSLTSKSPLNTVTINPYGTYGSYGTRLYGIEGDTGSVAGGARATIDLSKLEANGFLSGTATQRRNGFVKVEVPLNSSTVLTFVGMANNSRTNVPYGASTAEMAQYRIQLRPERQPALPGLHRLQRERVHDRLRVCRHSLHPPGRLDARRQGLHRLLLQARRAGRGPERQHAEPERQLLRQRSADESHG